MSNTRVFQMEFGKVYPMYVNKAERKGRTKAEVDQIIAWLTGYQGDALTAIIENPTTLEAFLENAPQLNPNRTLIKGVVCGVRVEEVEDRLMRELRYLDKLVDELARGKAMEKILRVAKD